VMPAQGNTRDVGTIGTGKNVGILKAVHPHVRGDNDKRRYKMAFTSVHPHVRGDNLQSVTRLSLRVGSPPHAWGQLNDVIRPSWVFRFTPTCVGTISIFQLSEMDTSVHPHVRGDNDAVLGMTYHESGSPPHAWGQWWVSGLSRMRGRFTPTCVGTISQVLLVPDRHPVHPHVRGDNCASQRSSRPVQRFTPTCVGTMPPEPCRPNHG